MRWNRTKLLAGCMALMCSLLLGGAASALSLNAGDITTDTVLISLNGKLEFSNIQFFSEFPDSEYTLTVLDDGLQLTGPMEAADGNSSEHYYAYTVRALDPSMLINGVSLFAPTEVVDVDPLRPPTFAKTAKTIWDGPGGPNIGIGDPLDVLRTTNFEGTYTEFDSVSFSPRETITILDGVRLFTGGEGDSAEAPEGITNRFSVVPEPATIGLFGSGLIGLTLAGRRRS